MMIPIFDYALTIVIFDKWEELKGLVPNEGLEHESRAVTVYNENSALVAVNAKRGSSIAHEALHVVNRVWNFIGYEPQSDNDEVSAYLLTYIYEKITDVYYKHTKDIM